MVANVATPATQSATEVVGRTTVEVGRVFGQNGTDGLILYALVLAIFLMFLALVAVIILAFRAVNKHSTSFAEAASEQAEALTKLSVALATSDAGEQAWRASLITTLARAEAAIARSEDR